MIHKHARDVKVVQQVDIFKNQGFQAKDAIKLVAKRMLMAERTIKNIYYNKKKEVS